VKNDLATQQTEDAVACLSARASSWMDVVLLKVYRLAARCQHGTSCVIHPYVQPVSLTVIGEVWTAVRFESSELLCIVGW
jgi:hypothetical protein